MTLPDDSNRGTTIESVIDSYITRELVTKPELLPLRNDSPLIESGILESLSILKLVLFLEKKFEIVVSPAELIPMNFETIDAICVFLRTKKGVH